MGPPKFNQQLESAALTQDLVMEAAGIRNRKPRIYQRDGSGDRSINGGYLVLGERLAGFAIERYDATKPLVVDPVMMLVRAMCDPCSLSTAQYATCPAPQRAICR